MDFEEDFSKRRENYSIGDDLSDFSVDELKALLTDLENEKERVAAELQQKEKKKQTADSFFK